MPTDSVLIFPPGFRVTNANGTPVSGAKIKFYNAGTVVTRDTVPGKVYKAEREPPPRASSLALFRVKEADR